MKAFAILSAVALGVTLGVTWGTVRMLREWDAQFNRDGEVFVREFREWEGSSE